MRRILVPVSVPLMAGLAWFATPGFSAGQAPLVAGQISAVLSADDLPVESVAQRGRLFRRGSPQVRQYRSYAIVPGPVTASVEAAAAPPPLIGLPVPAPQMRTSPSGSPRSSGGGKPSYMRADSKARGQFGR